MAYGKSTSRMTARKKATFKFGAAGSSKQIDYYERKLIAAIRANAKKKKR